MFYIIYFFIDFFQHLQLYVFWLTEQEIWKDDWRKLLTKKTKELLKRLKEKWRECYSRTLPSYCVNRSNVSSKFLEINLVISFWKFTFFSHLRRLVLKYFVSFFIEINWCILEAINPITQIAVNAHSFDEIHNFSNKSLWVLCL